MATYTSNDTTSPQIRAVHKIARGQSGSPPHTDLRDPEDNVRQVALATPGKRPGRQAASGNSAGPKGDRDVGEAESTALAKLSEQPEFCAATIPQIIGLLKDGDRETALIALAKLSVQPEMWPAIGNVIPQIVALLKDRNPDVQETASTALANFRSKVSAVDFFILQQN
ncbi:hypothetical protein B0H13DRAFT_2656472 [Mycena leptocephala]|nr:hypothetical protein B0H13DRAFT_2656472 [Mycena leptocephala]